jgi:hypothetical protein
MSSQPDTSIDISAIWMVGDRQFSLQEIDTGGAVLTISDGRELELSRSEWELLAKALGKLLRGLPAWDVPFDQKLGRRPKADGAASSSERLANAGEKWTPELDNELRLRFAAGERPGDIAVEFQRTSGAITARLVRLGLIVR